MAREDKQTRLGFDGTSVLKAIAIISVFLIHVLSSVKPSPFVNGSPIQFWVVLIDQLSRVSVPLFVALSGYGLYSKYANGKFSSTFFFKRMLKILPLYFLWSLIFFLLFYFVPLWASATKQPNFLWQLVLGRADYHLYFVPMILQIYIIFPVILKIFKRWPLITLLTAITLQLLWWWFFSYQGYVVTSWKYFAGDGEQYLWMTNWIAYFVLGMYLPSIWKSLENNKVILFFFSFMFIISAIYTILDALLKIKSGLDPLYALKFTRYPLFTYSFFAVIFISYIVTKQKNLNKLMIKIGEQSYFIYLSHTLFLRIIFFLIYL